LLIPKNDPRRIKFIVLLIVSALIVGLIHSIPSLYVRLRLGESYQGIFPLQSADEEHYNVCIKTAMEGKYSHRNNYLKEWRREEKGGIPPFRSEAILGFLGGLFPLSLGSWIFILRLLLPALAFLLFYAIFRNLDISPHPALFWSFLNLGAPYLVFGWLDPVSRPIFRFLSGRGFQFIWYEQYAIATLPWARVVNPQFSGLFFLGAVIFLIRLIRGKQRGISLVIFLVLFYFNFKLYFYFWSMLAALVGVSFLLSVLWKNKKAAFPLGVVIGLGLLVVLPLGLRLILRQDEYLASHLPIFSPGVIVAIGLLIVGGIVVKRVAMASWERVILFSSLGAVIIAMNQNIITGKIVQPWHYELFITPLLISMGLALLVHKSRLRLKICGWLKKISEQKPIFPLVCSLVLLVVFFLILTILFLYYFKMAPNYTDALFYIVAGMFGLLLILIFFQSFFYTIKLPPFTKERLAYFLGAGLLLIVFIEGITRQMFISARVKRQAVENQYLAAPFKWLRENTPQNSTVLASYKVSEMIPLYTPNTVYLCKNVFHEYYGSQENRWNRAINYFILTGYDEDLFREKIKEWPYSHAFWGLASLESKKDVNFPGQKSRVSEDAIRKVLGLFREKNENPLPEILWEFSLDYIFYGPEERKFFRNTPRELPFVKKIYEDDTPVLIYQITIP